MIRFSSIFIVFIFIMSGCGLKTPEWIPANGPLLSKWVKNIDPEAPLPEYPRPQMKREVWKNLNGLWDYAIVEKNGGHPLKYDGKILVPFAVESALSGVMKDVGEDNNLWYRRKFDVPVEWRGQNILLNFGAVDWEATVFINGKEVGTHRGGYDAFTIDITDAVSSEAEQEIIVKVWDPVSSGKQPRGKQVNNPRGIWYTSVTGIWQTVWLEPVEKQHIKNIKITPDIDKQSVSVSAVIINADEKLQLKVSAMDEGEVIEERIIAVNAIGELSIGDPKLWSPENPFLYDLEVVLMKDGKVIDRIDSYFGMRKIALAKEKNISKIFLNNEFYFQLGALDQGWWPDGLYTAPTDQALKYDIEVTKLLGFNMARKHVKVEPARWYYWCDKLGLLVWQDMPSGDEYIDPNEPDLTRTSESAEQFKLEWGNIIDQFYNTPSIITWVPFNEGWGQFDTEGIVNFTKEHDPTRLVINTSGWADRGVGDIHDIHAYPGPNMPEPEKDRAVVLGEFGGLGLPLEGHTWQTADNWGYRSFTNKEDLTIAYTSLLRELQSMIARGLSAAVYTQTTDVEVEVNGLMTYDRAVIKMDPNVISKVNQGYLPPIIKSKHDIFINTACIEMSNEIQKGEIRYTLDGSQPDNNSPVYSNPVEINSTANFKALTLFNDGTKSFVNEKTFSKVIPFASLKVSGLKNGIKYSYYEEGVNEWEKLPDFTGIQTKSDGVTDGINIDKAENGENFAMKFEGYVKLPESGIYTFYSSSDDGSKLFIHDELVVDNDYKHGMTEKSGAIALDEGLHPIKLFFFQGVGGKGLEVRFEGPGIDKQIVNNKFLYHE